MTRDIRVLLYIYASSHGQSREVRRCRLCLAFALVCLLFYLVSTYYLPSPFAPLSDRFRCVSECRGVREYRSLRIISPDTVRYHHRLSISPRCRTAAISHSTREYISGLAFFDTGDTETGNSQYTHTTYCLVCGCVCALLYRPQVCAAPITTYHHRQPPFATHTHPHHSHTLPWGIIRALHICTVQLTGTNRREEGFWGIRS